MVVFIAVPSMILLIHSTIYVNLTRHVFAMRSGLVVLQCCASNHCVAPARPRAGRTDGTFVWVEGIRTTCLVYGCAQMYNAVHSTMFPNGWPEDASLQCHVHVQCDVFYYVLSSVRIVPGRVAVLNVVVMM